MRLFFFPENSADCLDTLACNYNPEALFDGGNCEFIAPSGFEDCAGNCLNDFDNDGVCDELEISGCQDPLSCTFDSLATDSDGSCLLPDAGQTCCPAGIYFSEFTEGPANDTYFEIHNASSDSVLLDAFHVGRTANQLNPEGGFDFEDIQFPTGFRLGPNEVFVVAEEGANSTISNAAYFTVPEISSGDDAIGLIRSSDGAIVDQIGILGSDEGLGWTVSGIADATYNRTIKRKSHVADGNGGDWSASAGSNSGDGEWEVLSNVDLSDLGSHTQDGACSGQSPYLIRGCNNPVSCAYHPDANAHVRGHV